MFSDRIQWDVRPNALSTLLHDKRSAGETVLDLTESNPTRAGLAYDTEEILSALAHPEAMAYAPDPRGLEKARHAVSKYYRDRDQSVDQDAVFLTASTSEAYSVLFKLLGNPGDEILIPRPGYPLLSYLASFENLHAFSYPLRYDFARGWSIDIEVLEALITPKTKAVVVVHPNNPTGSFLKAKELTALEAICRRHPPALIVDEVFSDFAWACSPERVPTAANRTTALTFVLNGFSKMLGLPQMKLGWIVVGGDPETAQAAQNRLEMMLDFYLSPGTPVQHAAERLLAGRESIQRQIRSRIDANSRFLEDRLARTRNCRMLIREGGWYGIIEITDRVSDEDRVLQLLADDNTLVHPGYFYEFHREGFVVVSLLTPVETFHAGISNLVMRFGRG